MTTHSLHSSMNVRLQASLSTSLERPFQSVAPTIRSIPPMAPSISSQILDPLSWRRCVRRGRWSSLRTERHVGAWIRTSLYSTIHPSSSPTLGLLPIRPRYFLFYGYPRICLIHHPCSSPLYLVFSSPSFRSHSMLFFVVSFSLCKCSPCVPLSSIHSDVINSTVANRLTDYYWTHSYFVYNDISPHRVYFHV